MGQFDALNMAKKAAEHYTLTHVAFGISPKVKATFGVTPAAIVRFG